MKRLLALLTLLPLSAAPAVELPSRHHPVGVAVPETMQLPEALQADQQGRLVCSSCHGLEDMEEREPERIDPLAADFLLGGPYPELSDFCFRCHDQEPYQRLNIHLQLDAQGRPEQTRCKQCHLQVPDPEQPPDSIELRLPPQRLCLGCHLMTPHLNALEHRGEPDQAMRERIARAEREQRIKLPLDSHGHVTCITCHSPHQPGLIPDHLPGGRQVAERSVEQGPEYLDSRWEPVFEADKQERLAQLGAALGRRPQLRYRRLAGEVLVRLPAKNGKLCRACHDFDD